MQKAAAQEAELLKLIAQHGLPNNFGQTLNSLATNVQVKRR